MCTVEGPTQTEQNAPQVQSPERGSVILITTRNGYHSVRITPDSDTALTESHITGSRHGSPVTLGTYMQRPGSIRYWANGNSDQLKQRSRAMLSRETEDLEEASNDWAVGG